MVIPTITQLAVFVENRAGRLSEICALLGRAGINILGFSIADSAEYGIFRILVADADKAAQLLREAHFTVSRRQVLCLDVPHRPGGLAEALGLLSAQGINVEYMYVAANTLIVFNIENLELAARLLSEHGIALKSIEELAG
jgi:hypothetical protein